MPSSRNLAEYRFYRERMGADARPMPWGLAELEAFAATDSSDPFAGRVRHGLAPKVALQLEATTDPSISNLCRSPGVGSLGWCNRAHVEAMGDRSRRGHRVFRLRFQPIGAARVERLRRILASGCGQASRSDRECATMVWRRWPAGWSVSSKLSNHRR